jgi:hypothetical protein
VLDGVIQSAQTGHTQLLLLFPGPQSIDVASIAAARASTHTNGHAKAAKPYALLVLDGTWQFAKEMFQSLQGRLLPPQGPAVLVHLPSTWEATNNVAVGKGLLCRASEVTAQHQPASHNSACKADSTENESLHPHTEEDSTTSKSQECLLLLRTEPFVR